VKYSADFIHDHVVSLHKNSDDFENGDLSDRIYKYPYYILEDVLLSELDEEEFYIDEDKVNSMCLENTPIPPIVLTDYKSIIDGSHRIKVAKIQQKKTIQAYIGQKI
jgi:hypothetical protein